ncbi:hypothetical protein ACHAXR_005427 [Thalassiosira sp. AJA248-18]
MDSDNNDEDNEADTILSSIQVAKEVDPNNTTTSSAGSKGAKQGPSCRSVLFSRPSPQGGGGEHIYTACNGGSIRCLDSELAGCSINNNAGPQSQSPILWSIENAHNAGINKLYQLPHSSPCGPALVSGDDIGTVRLWDTRLCGSNNNAKSNNPFDNLMKLPTGCIQHWKVNHDYITDFETNNDGTTLFATSADGTLSVFDIRFVNRKGTPRSVSLPEVDPRDHTTHQKHGKNNKSSWEVSGYSQSDNQEDELLSCVLLKKSQKLLCGTQQGILSLFSYNVWGDISDRFPGHPHSIDALLKIDEDTVLTGSSDGLVRAVQLLPNALLGVLGGHDGFPVEGLQWSAGRKLVGSVSHDEYIRLWDASFLNEDDDESDDTGMKGMSTTKKSKTDRDSEDDWEDMDEDNDEEMDSDDSDSDDGEGGNKPNEREKIFKTENESFFSDL